MTTHSQGAVENPRRDAFSLHNTQRPHGLLGYLDRPLPAGSAEHRIADGAGNIELTITGFRPLGSRLRS